jgi:hypothetical protein
MSRQIRLETLVNRWYESHDHAIGIHFNEWCEKQPELEKEMMLDACGCCGGLHLDWPEFDCRAFYPQRAR